MTLKKIFVSTILGITFLTQNVSAKDISDSLVENLSCDNLTIDRILQKIRPTAFSVVNHLPLENWSFRSKGFEIAACWGMASTQRKLFYLLRLGEKSAPPVNLHSTLNLVRGATVGLSFMSADAEQVNAQGLTEKKLTEYHVIPVQEKNITEEWFNNSGKSFFDKLQKGGNFSYYGVPIFRNLQSETERSQERHFFRPRNIEMGMGSGPRSVAENRKTLEKILYNISTNRLTLINLRLLTKVQHIVIPKSFIRDENGNIWIYAYDSNNPKADQPIYFDLKNGHFYSPRIMGHLIGDELGTDYRYPLGVFIVDEEERSYIEMTLLKYYRSLCKTAARIF